MTSLEQLDSDVQDQLRRYWGVRDLGSLTEPPDGTDYDAILSYFDNHLEALGREAQAVKARIEFLLSEVVRYVGDESEVCGP